MQKQQAPGTETSQRLKQSTYVACLEAYSLYFFKVLRFSGKCLCVRVPMTC